jgi:hypothetical protein
MKQNEVGENCIVRSFITSPNIIRIKLRRMRWAGHIACMGRRGLHAGLRWEDQ